MADFCTLWQVKCQIFGSRSTGPSSLRQGYVGYVTFHWLQISVFWSLRGVFPTVHSTAQDVVGNTGAVTILRSHAAAGAGCQGWKVIHFPFCWDFTNRWRFIPDITWGTLRIIKISDGACHGAASQSCIDEKMIQMFTPGIKKELKKILASPQNPMIYHGWSCFIIGSNLLFSPWKSIRSIRSIPISAEEPFRTCCSPGHRAVEKLPWFIVWRGEGPSDEGFLGTPLDSPSHHRIH